MIRTTHTNLHHSPQQFNKHVCHSYHPQPLLRLKCHPRASFARLALQALCVQTCSDVLWAAEPIWMPRASSTCVASCTTTGSVQMRRHAPTCTWMLTTRLSIGALTSHFQTQVRCKLRIVIFIVIVVLFCVSLDVIYY